MEYNNNNLDTGHLLGKYWVHTAYIYWIFTWYILGKWDINMLSLGTNAILGWVETEAIQSDTHGIRHLSEDVNSVYTC